MWRLLPINQIHNGDCLELLQQVPDKSIDLICCDLPYGVTKNKWDCPIPLDKLWAQYTRIIKDNGAIILFAQERFTFQLALSNDKLYRYTLIWEKDRPSGFLNAKRMPLRSHEDILVFYKKLPTYNPQYWEGKPMHSRGKKFKTQENVNHNYGKIDYSTHDAWKQAGDTQKYPRSVLKFPRPHPPIHPTQKSVELVEWLVKTYSSEGELVLDNCSGSGTLAIACCNTNRNFICIEKDEEYYEMSVERLQKHLANT